METRIEKAIDIFLDAINKGTLAKGTCAACAVGNLVAHGMGGIITVSKRHGEIVFKCSVENSEWRLAFSTGYDHQNISRDMLKNGWVIKNIESTDFSWEELAAIEYAFEMNAKIKSYKYLEHTPKEIREDQIRGLEAVVKVMLSFTSDTQTDVKKVFTEKAEAITLETPLHCL